MGYLFLAALAVVGFVASIVCHLMGWLHLEPPWGKSVFVLHIGLLVLWIPLVTFATRTMPKPGRSNTEHLFAELPRWVRPAAGVLCVYALLNFAWFMYCASRYPPGSNVPSYLQLRFISGHWMLFYGMATMGFIALARLARKRKEPDSVN
jgi:hypothetical protein